MKKLDLTQNSQKSRAEDDHVADGLQLAGPIKLFQCHFISSQFHFISFHFHFNFFNIIGSFSKSNGLPFEDSRF
jgi:hypothetical protein